MKRGFTLIELLVVIAIVGILSSIILASLDTARTKGEIAAGKEYAAHVEHSIGGVEVGHWTFDEAATGGVAGDDSGNKNTCTVSGGVTSTTGVYNGAFLFDGSTGYLTCGSNSLLTLTSKWTVTFWAYPAAIGSFVAVVDGDGMGDPTGGWDIYLDSTGRVEYETNNVASLYSAGHLVAGKWQQVAVTYDSSQSPSMHFYIDGADAGSGSVAAPSVFTALDIGRRGAGSFYNGALDDLHIYNQALSTGQLEDRYRAELALRAKGDSSLSFPPFLHRVF